MIEELHRWVSWLGFVLGGTYLVTASVIFAPVRVVLARRGQLARAFLYCPACFATWQGFTSALVQRWPAAHTQGDAGWLNVWDLSTSALTAMALGLVWGVMIKYAAGNVYERELPLIFPEAEPEKEGAS